jgi:vacuolar-type H+-ATPase subunit H
MSKPEIDVVIAYIKTLDKKIDQFKDDAHDLLKGSMDRIEKTLEKIVATLNCHDDDIKDLKGRVDRIERRKAEISKDGRQLLIEILKGWIFPIAVILTLLWFGVK